MQSTSMYLFIAGVATAVVCIWVLLLFWMRQKIQKVACELRELARQKSENIIIDPQSCLYRGADSEYGNVKGNGVISLTNKQIMFKKLTGQRIDIDRSRISKVSVENGFKGETSFATGGRHLIVETSNGNRIGFLVKNAEIWIEKLHSA